MATLKRNKYLLSASISPELGRILEEKYKTLGVMKSFEVEQALRRYFGLELPPSSNQTQ